jgi:hypothetical protein
MAPAFPLPHLQSHEQRRDAAVPTDYLLTDWMEVQTIRMLRREAQ